MILCVVEDRDFTYLLPESKAENCTCANQTKHDSVIGCDVCEEVGGGR